MRNPIHPYRVGELVLGRWRVTATYWRYPELSLQDEPWVTLDHVSELPAARLAQLEHQARTARCPCELFGEPHTLACLVARA